MRRRLTRHKCLLCGEVVALPAGRKPLITGAAEQGQPMVRRISLDGEELHRCEIRATDKNWAR